MRDDLSLRSGDDYPAERMDHRVSGAGEPPILLLHGWGGSLQAMDVLSVPLTQHRRVMTVSLPGFGNSPEPAVPWGTWEYVAVLRRWCELQGVGQADIIGHSFGGRIAIGIAARHRDMVGKLVLIDSAGLKPRRSLTTRMKIMTARNLKRAGRIMQGRFEKFATKWRDQLGSTDWKLASPVMRRTLVNVIEEDLSGELGTLTTSTLLIWGEKDAATPLQMGRMMNRLIPGSSLEVIPGAGHFCYLERKGEVLSKIWGHLELPRAW